MPGKATCPHILSPEVSTTDVQHLTLQDNIIIYAFCALELHKLKKKSNTLQNPYHVLKNFMIFVGPHS